MGAKSGLISTILGIINASFNNFFPQSRHLIAEILSKRLKQCSIKESINMQKLQPFKILPTE